MAENAKVLVDTSVWIDFFDGRSETVAAMSALAKSGRIVICGQIRQEVLQGSRDENAFAKLEKQMAIWDSKVEEPSDFIEAARIFARLRWKGITVPPSDCLIAAVAIRYDLCVYTNDPDFDRISELQHYEP